MAAQFEKFIATMKKVLMLDQADLDFGIYRIMNQKRTQIEQYLNTDLRQQVKQSISENTSADTVTFKNELDKLVATLTAAGMNPDDSPKVKELKEKIAQSGNSEDLENEVYSHLTTFFSRYYDGGDFISQRRYKKDVYAIPYEGEEVKLHWANADQYYIKTGEYFRNYRFAIGDGKCCEFTLKEASTEQNNNVAQNNMERRFAICENNPVEVIDDTLHLYFTYELYPKATKQKALIDKAYETVKDAIPADFHSVLALRPTDSDRSRTLLQKHLTDYVARNTFDYFIHKDLYGFLSRELDFYIKNEILVIDDINARTPDEFLKHLTVIKTIKTVGMKLVTFLASLENYQKRLWLKKKFVVQADYCITLDRVSESLYAEIAANERQREEWVRLFAIDEIQGFMGGSDGYSVPLTVGFLKANPFLVLDTQFFSDEFKQKLLASIDNIDEQCDGLLINSENFQALELLQEKYDNSINGIYVDPPYNTEASVILYKNNYRDASWLSLISDRFKLGRNLLLSSGIQCTTIDDTEQARLQLLINDVFGENNYIGTAPIKINPSGRPRERSFALTHEYAIFAGKSSASSIYKIPRSTEQMARYNQQDETGVFEWRNLRREGSNSDRENGQRQYYPIFAIVEDGSIRIPEMHWIETQREWIIDEIPLPNEVVIYPNNDDGREKNWRWSEESVKADYSQFVVRIPKGSSSPQVYYKYRPNMNGITPLTMWTDAKFSATEHGTKVLKDIFKGTPFSYPKSIYAVEESLNVIGAQYNNRSIFLDYFGGSGTTAHAVINLNRENGENGKRKYILCEMGEYFDTVTKPRIQKVIYSKDWKDGKPVSREGSSHCFKYMRLEQYEDTLNNLTLAQPNIDSTNVDFYGGYMLGYMLDTETRDSLFNLQWFRNPWNTKLRITRQNETKEEQIDLIETFNYLIGLNVQGILHPKQGICTVEGITRRGEKTLVIWRNCDEVDNDALNDFFRCRDYSTRDTEFDRIYVNGDNNLENLRTDKEQWKVVLTEQEFAKRMFEK